MPFKAEIRREPKENREKNKKSKIPHRRWHTIFSFVAIGSPAPIMLVCIKPNKGNKKRENGEYMKPEMV